MRRRGAVCGFAAVHRTTSTWWKGTTIVASDSPAQRGGDDQKGQAEAPSATQAEQQPTSTDAPTGTAPEANGEKKAGRPRKQSTARKTRTVTLTLTVTGTEDGDWQADLQHGTTRVVRGLAVPAASVAKAAKELHPDIADRIETVLDAAREQHRARVEQLEAELEQVKRALAELSE
jgi:hypothetical protein